MDFDPLDPDLWGSGDPKLHGLPYEHLARLRETPCLHQALTTPEWLPWVWIVSRYDDVLAVSRDAQRFTSGRGITVRNYDALGGDSTAKPSMLAMDGERHARNRRVVSRGFSPVVMRAFQARLHEICDAAIDKALCHQRVDFVEVVSSQVPLNALSELLGVPETDRAKLLKWVNTFTVPTDPDYSPSHDDLLAAVGHLCDYALELLAERRDNPGEDVMSKVAQAYDAGEMSEDEVMGITLLLLAAGNETTRNALSHGLHALIADPDQMALLREDPERHMKLAVEEVLRIASPVVFVRRTAVEPVELHGQVIKAGDPVVFMHASANTDPDMFADPTRFDITREPNKHVAFGSGPHLCLGATVARLEIRCTLERLLERTSDIKLAGDIVYARDSFLRGVKRLPVELIPS